jgi:hypothetical protein
MKYILGGGISGLIAAFLNPEYQIITDKLGGFAATEYGSSTFVLHDTPETKLFLKLLGISCGKEDLKITYHPDKVPTKETILEIIRKKLYDLKTKEQLFVNDFYEINNQPYIHSEKKGTPQVLKVHMDELLEVLYKELTNRIIKAEVISINRNFICTDKGCFEYDQIISTIPAPIFWKIYLPEFPRPTLRSADITLLISRKSPFSVEEGTIAYYLEQPFSRVIHKNGLYFFEYTGHLTEEDLKKISPSIIPLKIEHQPFARLEDTFGNIAPNSITFLGRFAEWNKDANIGTTIKKMLNKYSAQEIWAAQKKYNQNFISYTEDIGYRQQITKDYILHMFSEMDELLQTINWKLNNNKDKKINFDKLKEEWIDAYKFWLSIGILWDITPEDFEKAYWEKTNKLEKIWHQK